MVSHVSVGAANKRQDKCAPLLLELTELAFQVHHREFPRMMEFLGGPHRGDTVLLELD